MITNMLLAHNKRHEIRYRDGYIQMLHTVSRFARAVVTYSEVNELYREFLSIVHTLIYCEDVVLYQYQEKEAMLSPVAYWSMATGVVNLLPSQNAPDSQAETTIAAGVSGLSADLLAPVNLNNTQSLVASTAFHRHTFHRRFILPGQQKVVAELTVPLEVQNILAGVLLLRRSVVFSGKDTRILRDVCAIAAMSWHVIKGNELMRKAEREQEEAHQRQTQFLSLLTHELRSPLNSMHGYLDLALMGAGGELNVEQHEFVQRARVASQHLYALLEDLLCTARVDAGQLRLQRTIVHLPDSIDGAIEELALTAADHGIELRADIEPQFPRLYADATRLQQILRNLLSNAIQFTPEGGKVKITASIEREPVSTSSDSLDIAEDIPAIACLRVCDTGIGIAAEHQQRIFERFYRVCDKNVKRSTGQGLGLFIVKHLVELHGGTVTVESALGQGSVFTCLIPGLLS